MTLAQRLERLDPRERQLLRLLMLILGAFVVILVPIVTEATLKSKHDELESYRAVIDDIIASQPAIAKAEQKRQGITQRYAKPAPPLASFIDSLARELQIDVPESQDRPTVPHGKRYEERANRVQLRKVGLANLAKLLEKIESAGYPLVLSKLNIKKRISEPDSYDVELIVSAYDRKEPAKTESTEAKGSTDGAAEKPAAAPNKGEP